MKTLVAAAVLGLVTAVGALAQAPASLDLKLNNLSSYTGSSAENDLYIYFSNGAAELSGAPAFDITFNSGTAVTFGSFTSDNKTFQNYLSNGIALSTVANSTFTVTTASSVAVYIGYGNQFSNLSAAPSFLTGGVSANLTFQNFEITRVGGNGDQGNLTNINYFTAPLSITSYNGTQKLQSTGFTKNAQQIGEALAAVSSTPGGNAISEGGKVIRYVGPSTYLPAQTPPYNSFIPYLNSVGNVTTPVTNTIQNSNAFNTDGSSGATGSNYNFQFSYQTSYTTNATGVTALVLNGNITTTIKNNVNGTFTTGPTFENASITIDAGNATSFNGVVYGQSAGQYSSAVTYGPGWSDFQTYVNNSSNNLTSSGAYATTQALAVGEITSAMLMGFLGNTLSVNGTALNTMPSEEWWKLYPLQAFSEIQTNPNNYNQWANEIYSASFSQVGNGTAGPNGVYSIPYSDRLGSGPLVNSVFFSGNYVTSWEVGIYDPVPEPSAVALAVAGGAFLLWRRKRLSNRA